MIGVDVNENMLDVARSVTQPAEIDWYVSDAGALPLPDASVDVVCCQQGMQYLPDRALAVREMGRTLAPGGRVALAVWRDIAHSPALAGPVGELPAERVDTLLDHLRRDLLPSSTTRVWPFRYRPGW